MQTLHKSLIEELSLYFRLPRGRGKKKGKKKRKLGSVGSVQKSHSCVIPLHNHNHNPEPQFFTPRARVKSPTNPEDLEFQTLHLHLIPCKRGISIRSDNLSAVT